MSDDLLASFIHVVVLTWALFRVILVKVLILLCSGIGIYIRCLTTILQK